MLNSPLTVINETLEHLHGLRELLLDEVNGSAKRSPELTMESRLCKEALQTIRILIPKIEAVRNTQIAGQLLDRPRVCLTCDD